MIDKKEKKHIIDDPKLMTEWNWEKNNELGLDPKRLVIGSAKKVFWQCNTCGNIWQTAIRQRTQKNSGCPICAKTKLTQNRLKTILSKKGGIKSDTLLKEWNYEKNHSLTPNDVTEGSNKKVWWRCSICGYEWEARISNRNHGRNCPVCSNKIIIKGKNDFQTTNPELMAQWNWEKNNALAIRPNNITKGSGKKVWWICPNGHEWQATILHRVGGTGCPICNSGRQTSFAEQAVFYYIKKYFNDAQNKVQNVFGTRMEFDIYIPSLRLVIEYDGGFWHKKENSQKKEFKKYDLCKKNGLILVRIREPEDKNFQNSNYTILTGQAVEHSSIKADYVIFSDKTGKNKNLNKVIQNVFKIIDKITSLYFNKFAHNFYDIDTERDKDKIYKNLTVEYAKALKVANPILSKEWHPTKNNDLTPTQVSFNSKRKVWWLCGKCGHEWKTSIVLRVTGSGCPKCAIEKNKNGTHAEAKQIFQYSMDGVFIKKWDCISTAGRELKINSSNISMCAKGIRTNAGGFRWTYEYVDTLPPILKKEKKSRKGLNSKKIAKCDTMGFVIEVFNSLNDAQEKTGINATSISKMLNGHIKKAGGYCWKFIKE